jgi:spore germination protein YaaH
MELSSFAYSHGEYIEKVEALRLIDRKKADIECDGVGKTVKATYGRHKRREVVYESLENTKAKLDLVSELGFMGVSFDIGRICTQDLMTMASSFDIISSPLMLPKVTENQEM